tara:strand:+ start:28 stop:405 length:378 start_codon:yes stop_codon:yes gene_type:complete
MNTASCYSEGLIRDASFGLLGITGQMEVKQSGPCNIPMPFTVTMEVNPGRRVILFLKRERVKLPYWNYLTGASIIIHVYTGTKDPATNVDEKLGAMMAGNHGKTGALLTRCQMETKGEPMVAWVD